MRCNGLAIVAALAILAVLTPVAVVAQSGGGYGPGSGSGPRSGMMGGGYGPRGGMMGGGYGYSQGGAHQIGYGEAMRLLRDSAALARVDRSQNRVVFSGHRVLLAMAAVQPNFPDTTFEVAGLVDPTIVILAGATVTLDLVNMDYGQDMEHGVVLSTVAPPYPVLGMMSMLDSFAEVGILSPRSAENARSSAYEEGSVTFQAPAPGVYYYLCQYYDHASKGMFGRLIVQAD